MKVSLRKRSAQLLGATGVALVAGLIGAGAAAASTDCINPVGSEPFLLHVNPGHGDMTTDPATAWSTWDACPADYQSSASLAIVTRTSAGEVQYHTASSAVAADGSRLSGTFNASMGAHVVADGLQAGSTYEVIVRCFNANFQFTPVQSTFIKIAADGQSWRVRF